MSFTLTTLVNLLSWPSHLLMWSVSAWETEEGLLWSDPEPELTTTIVHTQSNSSAIQHILVFVYYIHNMAIWHAFMYFIVSDITRSFIFDSINWR